MKISIIAAIGNETNVIGGENKLLWHITGDLKRFKRITKGCVVIMGKNTWDSLPIRPLPHRRNIVLSRKIKQLDGASVVSSITEALELCTDETDIFVIGGAEIYKQMIPLADTLFLTKVFGDFEGDKFFPTIGPEWELTNCSDVLVDINNGIRYCYQTFVSK